MDFAYEELADMYLMCSLAQGNEREAREGYIMNAFRTADFHLIRPSAVWIEDCEKPAHLLSPIQKIWSVSTRLSEHLIAIRQSISICKQTNKKRNI